jgi:hypothetical protein
VHRCANLLLLPGCRFCNGVSFTLHVLCAFHQAVVALLHVQSKGASNFSNKLLSISGPASHCAGASNGHVKLNTHDDELVLCVKHLSRAGMAATKPKCIAKSPSKTTPYVPWNAKGIGVAKGARCKCGEKPVQLSQIERDVYRKKIRVPLRAN